MRRRTFLTAASAAVAAPAFAKAPMRILVLGGTNFLGPAVVSRAIQDGHDVTLFNRGVTRPYLFPDLERLRGDRDRRDLDSLRGRTWDAVIDIWPEHADLVRDGVDLLADRTEYYFFVSSIAAYADFSTPGMTEDAATRSGPPGDYGAEKVRAESIVQAAFGDRCGVARCGAIVGPYDPSPAYHFWLRRLATRDSVLCPGDGRDPVQAVDSRDVAAWIVDCATTRRAGVYNLTGPAAPPTLRRFIEATRAGVGSKATLTWVDADLLRRRFGVASFIEMPLWAPLDEDAGFYQIDGRRAINAGLRYRSIEQTAADSWRWFQSHFFKDTQFPMNGWGVSAGREDEILAGV